MSSFEAPPLGKVLLTMDSRNLFSNVSFKLLSTPRKIVRHASIFFSFFQVPQTKRTAEEHTKEKEGESGKYEEIEKSKTGDNLKEKKRGEKKEEGNHEDPAVELAAAAVLAAFL